MRIAFAFPGQGSQSVGMLSGFADNAVVTDYMAPRQCCSRRRSCQTHRRRSGGSAQPDDEHAARTARGLWQRFMKLGSLPAAAVRM